MGRAPHRSRGRQSHRRVLGSLVRALRPQPAPAPPGAAAASGGGGGGGSYRALMTRLDDESKKGVTELVELSEAPSPQPDDADVTVRVRYSNINYKDGMVLGGLPGVAKAFPLVAGIDAAGEVIEAGGGFEVGDEVCLTGGYAGQHYCGGFSQVARLRSVDLVPLPKGLSLHDTMAIGTAGFTAMQSIMHLEEAGALESRKAEGPVLVTGAAGGVGSVAVAILACAAPHPPPLPRSVRSQPPTAVPPGISLPSTAY
jgi:D-arabinose 1-dehydrogenase-like Zn-dependent alcohol dehydrogenase